MKLGDRTPKQLIIQTFKSIAWRGAHMHEGICEASVWQLLKFNGFSQCVSWMKPLKNAGYADANGRN